MKLFACFLTLKINIPVSSHFVECIQKYFISENVEILELMEIFSDI